VEGMTGAGTPHDGEDTVEPAVTCVLDRDTARLTVTGELTEAARRPLVRVLTDLLLSEASLRRVELDLRAVTFLSSAGLSVLVQVQRLVAPRGIEPVLVAPSPAVTGPLLLSGLWHRFTNVVEAPEASGGS
jgi:anti-anti-sigma factor